MESFLDHLSVPGFFDAPLAWRSLPGILSGLPMSVFLLAVCFLTANCWGICIMLLRTSRFRVLRVIGRFYISFFRGTPFLVLLFITYFGLNLDAIPAAIVTFTVAPAAFIAEIYRAALLGVDDGQREAARSLGMHEHQVLAYVVFPQAFRIATPALGNVLVDMFKGTSLAAMVTVNEMFMQAKIAAGANQDYMTIYIEVAILYWLGCIVLALGQGAVEKHFNRYKTAAAG